MSRLVKKLRGLVKQFVPYGIQAAYIRRTYGIVESFETRNAGPFRRFALTCARGLPYGLVRACTRVGEGQVATDVRTTAVETRLFDREWYVAHNADVDFSAIDPLEHFFTCGWREDRDPSADFSVRGYRARYAQEVGDDVNPLEHFLLAGRRKGYDTCSPGPFLGGAPTARDRRIARARQEPVFFSVVVASYNYEALVLETLESLVAQTYRNFEIVVVDDGSKDRSLANIRAFADAHRDCGVRIRVLTHPGLENRGLAATVRLGVENSVGEFVAFCESDDLWTPDHLAELAKFLGTYGSAEVIANDVDIFGEPARVAQLGESRIQRFRALRHASNRISPRDFRAANYLLTFSSTCVKRTALLACDWNPVARPAALDWWLWRQLCFDRPVHFLDRVLTRWRMHDSYMFRANAVQVRAKPLAELQEDFARACDSLLRRQHPLAPSAWLLGPAERPAPTAYRFTPARRRRFLRDRAEGLERYRAEIARNAGARILVCLHLYYEDAWDLIAEYLANLRPYRNVRYVITCVREMTCGRTLEKIRAFAPDAEIVFTPNRGFDVGPFVETLRTVDLGAYDIVFKLQSKGVRRPEIYIYGQYFRRTDWFFNLFEGVLGGRTVHAAIDRLLRGEAGLAAAENLIVADPKHKRFFMERFCAARGLPFHADYRFVAGTCFAIRAAALKPLQDLGLGIADFTPARPGEFSLAHAIERWMCFAADGAAFGTPVERPTYPRVTAARRATDAVRMLDDPRFDMDYDFFYRVLEMRPVYAYEVVRVRLGDITRHWYDGRLYPLAECAPYRWLCGDMSAYDDYCRINRAVSGFEMSPARFARLVEDLKEFDPRRMPVVRGTKNIIQDGQHRCCILLKRYGPDHAIDVVRIRE